MNVSPRALLLVVAVGLRVCALTRLRSNCSHHICAICAPPKLQCLQVGLLHRGLSTFCLSHHMPCSAVGAGSGSSSTGYDMVARWGCAQHSPPTPIPYFTLSLALHAAPCHAQSRRLIHWWLHFMARASKCTGQTAPRYHETKISSVV